MWKKKEQHEKASSNTHRLQTECNLFHGHLKWANHMSCVYFFSSSVWFDGDVRGLCGFLCCMSVSPSALNCFFFAGFGCWLNKSPSPSLSHFFLQSGRRQAIAKGWEGGVPTNTFSSAGPEVLEVVTFFGRPAERCKTIDDRNQLQFKIPPGTCQAIFNG